MRLSIVPLPILVMVAACSQPVAEPPSPPALHFDLVRFVTEEYLAGTDDSRCGPMPGRSRAWIEVRAPLPDGSWFSIQAAPGTAHPEPFVVLARGWSDRPGSQGLLLDPDQGLVRSIGPGETKTYGLRTPVAGWLQEIGNRALALPCAVFTEKDRW
jgi:hypothetical protein